MSKVTRRGFIKKVAGTAAALGVSGIVGKSSVFAAGEKTIKWGFLDTLSGTFGIFGKGMIGGVQLAIKEINDAGGILGRRIELVVEDDEGNTEVAARKARKLILKDKVDIIHGGASTACSASIMGVCNQYKTLYFDTETDSATILRVMGDTTFEFAPLCEEVEMAHLLALIKKYKPEELKRWFIFFPDYAYGHDMREVWVKGIRKYLPDAEIVGIMGHPFGEVEYSSYIVSILAKKPQVFCSYAWAGDAMNFIIQATPYGFFERVPITAYSTGFISTMVALKQKCPALNFVTDQGMPYLSNMEATMKKLYDYTGEWPNQEHAPNYYDAPYYYKDAVEKAGTTDSIEVSKALVGMEFNKTSGRRRVRKDHFVEVDYIPSAWVESNPKYEFKVPGEVIKIPYKEVEMSIEEKVKLGCNWCKDKY